MTGFYRRFSPTARQETMVTLCLISPLPEDGEPDIADYNHELEALGNPKWFGAPWLFSECYLYRRLSTFFTLTKHWKSHDVFNRQKVSTFRSSLPAVLELAKQYQHIVSTIHNRTEIPSDEQEKLLFTEVLEICLWGNATDLSLLTTLSYEDIQNLQGAEARKRAEKNILVSDVSAVYETLVNAQKNAQPGVERKVDIVLDNSGFELYVDLILAGYLLEKDLATTVILHPKLYPWFVSDVLPHDFLDLLSALSNPQKFFFETPDGTGSSTPSTPLTDEQTAHLTFLFNNLSTHHAEGRLILRPHRFWTTAHSYHRLSLAEPNLKADLDSSEMVIFKGDLNYRKLTGDVMWDPTSSFVDAIGSLSKGTRTLALRTCKADVVVGLPQSLDEQLKEKTGNTGAARKWAWDGKYGMIQFWDGKK